MAVTRFSWNGFLIRWVASLVLVLGTFNPTDFSYYGWVIPLSTDNAPLKVLAGIAILICFVIFFRATWRSLGPIGLALAVAFFGTIVWAMAFYGLLDTGQTTVMTYVILILIATVMAVGISWSHVRRRVSGQVDTDDVDE
jgi:hypothetical protein